MQISREMDAFSKLQSNQVPLPQRESWPTEVASYLRHRPGLSNCKKLELRDQNNLTVRGNLRIKRNREAT